jgi:hypothetical protein
VVQQPTYRWHVALHGGQDTTHDGISRARSSLKHMTRQLYATLLALIICVPADEAIAQTTIMQVNWVDTGKVQNRSHVALTFGQETTQGVPRVRSSLKHMTRQLDATLHAPIICVLG